MFLSLLKFLNRIRNMALSHFIRSDKYPENFPCKNIFCFDRISLINWWNMLIWNSLHVPETVLLILHPSLSTASHLRIGLINVESLRILYYISLKYENRKCLLSGKRHEPWEEWCNLIRISRWGTPRYRSMTYPDSYEKRRRYDEKKNCRCKL